MAGREMERWIWQVVALDVPWWLCVVRVVFSIAVASLMCPLKYLLPGYTAMRLLALGELPNIHAVCCGVRQRW
jgi:hypothetical protein